MAFGADDWEFRREAGGAFTTETITDKDGFGLIGALGYEWRPGGTVALGLDFSIEHYFLSNDATQGERNLGKDVRIYILGFQTKFYL